MTDYRYVFGTLRTEQVVEEIPLYGVFMSMEMNAGGDFQGTFQLDMTGKDNATLLSACIPGRTWVACERNGICIWHGYIWSRVYSAQSKSVQLFAQSFEKYPEKRRVMQDLFYEDVEQVAIFQNLWGLMMSDYGSNINVNLPTMPNSSVLKSLNTLFSDNKYYNEVMSAIADLGDGFDWRIEATKDGVNYRKDLLIGYPTLGTDPFPGSTVFEFPGNITQYYFTEAMADGGTDVFVVGSGEGSDQILGFQEDTVLIDSGMARWDVNVSRTDVEDQTTADQIALLELERRRAPMPVIKLQVKADKTPEFGSYSLGDSCRIYIKDARFPSGTTFTKRLLRWELTPQSSDNAEEASLVFEGDPDV